MSVIEVCVTTTISKRSVRAVCGYHLPGERVLRRVHLVVGVRRLGLLAEVALEADRLLARLAVERRRLLRMLVTVRVRVLPLVLVDGPLQCHVLR